MSLRIESLRLRDFRNYQDLRLDGLGGLTVFVGPNAVGKTNIVEGIQLLTALSSFRAARGADMIRYGQDMAFLECSMVSETRNLSLTEVIRDGSRTYALNGKKKAAADVQGLLPAVVFSPEDLELVKGAHSVRRNALDMTGCQLSKNHRVIRKDYERLIKHKNALLKAEADPLLIQSVDDMLVPHAVQLYLYRSALFNNLANRMKTAMSFVSGDVDQVSFSYVASWEDEAYKRAAEQSAMDASYDKASAQEAMSRALDARRAEERARKRCVVGPHADRIELFINGRNAGRFASQGQQRSLALAWRVAELELYRSMSDTEPVLLLDDVMSELDGNHREGLMGLITDEVQTFITTTEVSLVGNAGANARVISLPL